MAKAISKLESALDSTSPVTFGREASRNKIHVLIEEDECWPGLIDGLFRGIRRNHKRGFVVSSQDDICGPCVINRIGDGNDEEEVMLMYMQLTTTLRLMCVSRTKASSQARDT
jgi:hypothetical protein